MDRRRADPPAARTAFGCLSVLLPLAVAAGLGLVVFVWNVNAPT